MTGLTVRVQRDGSWLNLDIDELADAELTAFAAGQSAGDGWSWAIVLAKWIRDHVRVDGVIPNDDIEAMLEEGREWSLGAPCRSPLVEAFLKECEARSAAARITIPEPTPDADSAAASGLPGTPA